jgi:hypothetical protein
MGLSPKSNKSCKPTDPWGARNPSNVDIREANQGLAQSWQGPWRGFSQAHCCAGCTCSECEGRILTPRSCQPGGSPHPGLPSCFWWDIMTFFLWVSDKLYSPLRNHKWLTLEMQRGPGAQVLFPSLPWTRPHFEPLSLTLQWGWHKPPAGPLLGHWPSWASEVATPSLWESRAHTRFHFIYLC